MTRRRRAFRLHLRKGLAGLAGVAAAAFVVLAALACSGGGDSTGPSPDASPATTAAADEFARSMLLTVDDFPEGWRAATETNDDAPADQCNADDEFPGREGRAESGDFAFADNQTSVSEIVVVFDTASNASAGVDEFESNVACFVETVNSGARDGGGVVLSDARWERVPFEDLGSETRAYRVEFLVTGNSSEEGPGEQRAFLDVVAVVDGRIGYSLTTFKPGAPFDVETLLQLARTAEAKIKQAP